jgi:hypothetical protein
MNASASAAIVWGFPGHRRVNNAPGLSSLTWRIGLTLSNGCATLR